MKHQHTCHDCGATIYTCHEPILIDDGGRWCANAPMNEHEFCDDCRMANADDEDNDDLCDASIGGAR